MTELTITGIPASIPRSVYLEMIERLGLEPEDLRELTWGWDKITAVVMARNEHGERYVESSINEIAVHEISIPIVDDDPDD